MTMTDSAQSFLAELLDTPSPSGNETLIQQVIERWAQPLADEIQRDTHGNLVAIINPMGSPRVLFDAHCDQIGLLVQHVDDRGFIHCVALGGWDMQILLGQNVTVWTDSGPIPGVIARKPKHLLSSDEAKSVPEMRDLWIDIGSCNREETFSIVAIGDPVTLALGHRRLRNGTLSGVKMDDTVGIWVVFETLRLLASSNPVRSKDRPAFYFVSAVQEEVGLRGARTAAFGINPDIGIAVDVTHATDCPTIDVREHGLVKLGYGPVLMRGPNVNPPIFQQLVSIAERNQWPIQRKAAGVGLSNDANVIQLNAAGVATACVGIPNRYMHSPVETVALADLEVASQLLAAFAKEVKERSAYIPR